MPDTTATISLNTEDAISPIPRTIFGGFAEHMGRCIYGGIFDPESDQADEAGVRKDVLAALREMDLSVLRYPGGNFVSSYDWCDGVGPRDQRPRRRELAWQQHLALLVGVVGGTHVAGVTRGITLGERRWSAVDRAANAADRPRPGAAGRSALVAQSTPVSAGSLRRLAWTLRTSSMTAVTARAMPMPRSSPAHQCSSNTLPPR